MESVYQQLRTRAPGWIEVGNTNYIATLSHNQEDYVFR